MCLPIVQMLLLYIYFNSIANIVKFFIYIHIHIFSFRFVFGDNQLTTSSNEFLSTASGSPQKFPFIVDVLR